MSLNPETLYRLLPAIYRVRDADLAAGLPGLLNESEANELAVLEGQPNLTTGQQVRLEILKEKAARGPLKALCYLLAEQLGLMEENLTQLYDDLFIETCAPWVLPYLGDLIGYQTLHPLGKMRGLERAEIAHTIALRRRKGTIAALEQLARDVTQWDVRAVEFFQSLASTQYMNHVRLFNRLTPDVRQWEPLSRSGTGFDSYAHTVDVRLIEKGSGKFNIPNIGIYLWRLNAYSQTRSPALRLDDRRWFFSPLGHPLPLFNHPRAEIEITHIAEPINVAEPISRRMLDAYLSLYYGSADNPHPNSEVDNAEPSIVLYIDGSEVPRAKIVACNLSDVGVDWLHRPKAGCYAIDPVLGRIALATDLPVPKKVEVTYHRGFSADLGGGEYPRAQVFDDKNLVLRVPDDFPTVQSALDALKGSGMVLITNSGRYEEALSITVAPGKTITLSAENHCFPTFVVPVTGTVSVSGGLDSEFILDGVLLTAKRESTLTGSIKLSLVHVPTTSGPIKLSIFHCTLVPGRVLDLKGEPLFTNMPAVNIEAKEVSLVVDSSIVGAMYLHEMTKLQANDSIIDATSQDRFALAGISGIGSCGKVSLDACTVIGKVRAHEIGVISNSLLLARQQLGSIELAIQVNRRQTGCIRFSYLPLDSRVPTRYRCQPDGEKNPYVVLNLGSQRFGTASYCQLNNSTSNLIRQGADDESEMGAFHFLFSPQREANLHVRLREYLRVGLSAGIFYES